MIEALVDYLADLLRYRGHFNIDDELQQSNIEVRQKALWSYFQDNPLFRNIDEGSFQSSEKFNVSRNTK